MCMLYVSQIARLSSASLVSGLERFHCIRIREVPLRQVVLLSPSTVVLGIGDGESGLICNFSEIHFHLATHGGVVAAYTPAQYCSHEAICLF